MPKKSVVPGPVIFRSVVNRFDMKGGLAMHYVEVPDDVVQQFVQKKPARLICTANDLITWHGALMPMGNGRKYITIKQQFLKKLHLNIGSTVQIGLVKDESEFGMKMPEELNVLLDQDDEGRERFLLLTPGKQRNIIYYVSMPRSEQLRIQRAIQLIENLKRTPRGKETVRAIFGVES